MSSVQIYAVYLIQAADNHPTGYVVNNILWDGLAKWAPPAGQAAIADPDGKYPVGSLYTPPTAVPAT